ncbi:MAG: DNA polymerase III subunit delta [Bacteroidales bacterium]|nr:DNA polymerase III subunit delta [Bacteroidales bacterium]MCF8455395.1 DNA polymerase III subunit delta [Bacteroidales bacterium]
MQFQKIIGQEKVKQRFIRSVKENRISHAQLLTGPPGVGKLALAIAYAQFVSCTNRQENDSCGVCPSCKKYEKLIHPDLHFVFPVVSTPKFDKPVSDHYIAQWRELVLSSPYFSLQQWLDFIGSENKQGLISKNESSEILRKLYLKTFEAEYKIMIIWQPDKMNLAAANKLLKLIEEPPEKTLFLLVCEDQEQLLKTILSRTQIVAVTQIDPASLQHHLADNFEISEDEALNIVNLCHGSFLEAQNLIRSSDESRFNFENFSNLMRICYKKDVVAINAWVDEISRIGREKQKSFMEYSLRLVRESFMLNQKQDRISFLAKEEKEFASKFSPFINERNTAQIYEQLNQAHFHIERNGYAKLVFMDMSLNMIKLLKL